MTIEEIQKSTEFQTLIAECTAYDYKESLEEKKPKSYKVEKKPVFKSSMAQFMTVIYSVDYIDTGKDTGKDTGNVTKLSLSCH